MNICKDCNIEKPIADFTKDKNYILKIRNRCGECRMSFRELRKESINERKRMLYKTTTTDSKREILNLKAKENYTKNYLNSLMTSCKAKKRTHNIPFDLNKNYLEILYEKQSKACYYCNIELNTIIGNKNCDQISIDRIDSSNGHVKDNVVLTCLFCNYAKNTSNINYFKNFINNIKTGIYNDDNLIFDKYWVRKLYNLIIQRDKNSDITKEWIQSQIIKQSYLCHYSGLKFVITEEPRYPFKPSIERLDNTKFYEKDNCVLVCLGINYGRSNNSIEKLQSHLNKIRNNK